MSEWSEEVAEELKRWFPLDAEVEPGAGGRVNALLFIELEPGAETWHCGVWLSLYGAAADRAPALQRGLDAMLDRLFRGPVAPAISR